MHDIFLICPVRNATEKQKQEISDYINYIERKGKKIYYPARDTNQNDPIGYQICCDNRRAILEAKEIQIVWDPNSQGSLFDLGMAFAYNKPFKILNVEDLQPTDTKSFTNMIRKWGGLEEKCQA